MPLTAIKCLSTVSRGARSLASVISQPNLYKPGSHVTTLTSMQNLTEISTNNFITTELRKSNHLFYRLATEDREMHQKDFAEMTRRYQSLKLLYEETRKEDATCDSFANRSLAAMTTCIALSVIATFFYH